MAVCTKEIVFILPPKTGSAWVRTAMNNAKIEWWQDGDEHGHPKKPIKDRLVCTVVRNPLHWLRSYFMFQFISPVRLYPELDAILDRLKEPGDWCWNEFVREVTTKHPRFVTNLFDWYVSPYEGNGRFVLGKTETIVQDVVAALYEALAATWGSYVDTEIGPRDEKLSQVADRYQKLAKQWRKDYGYGSTALATGQWSAHRRRSSPRPRKTAARLVR